MLKDEKGDQGYCLLWERTEGVSKGVIVLRVRRACP